MPRGFLSPLSSPVSTLITSCLETTCPHLDRPINPFEQQWLKPTTTPCPVTSFMLLLCIDHPKITIRATHFLSTTEFTIMSQTISLQGWVSDVGCRMSYVVCRMSYVGWRMSDGVCRMAYVGWRMLDGVCPPFIFHDRITFERFALKG